MTDRETTTIEVRLDTYRALNARKNPGDSFDDVIRRSIGVDDIDPVAELIELLPEELSDHMKENMPRYSDDEN